MKNKIHMRIAAALPASTLFSESPAAEIMPGCFENSVNKKVARFKRCRLASIMLVSFCWLLASAQPMNAQVICSTTVPAGNCAATTYAISTIQTFRVTCSGTLLNVVVTNVSTHSDDLRGSGLYVQARFRAANGTVLGVSGKTDQWFPGATLTFDFRCMNNIFLLPGVVYQVEFLETTNTTPLVLFCKALNNPYNFGNVIEDGVAQNTADITNWRVNVVQDVLSLGATTQTQNVSNCNIFTNSSSQLLAKVVPATPSAINGNTTARVWLQADEYAAFVRRHYQIYPETGGATATGWVTLYFNYDEFSFYNLYNTVKLPVDEEDATGKSNLRIVKRPGVSSDGSGLPGTYSGSPVTIDPDDANIVYNVARNRWEVSFQTTGFGGFYVTNSLSVLPVKWLAVNAAQRGKDGAIISWKVEENNVADYNVEQSLSGSFFSNIGTVKSKGDGVNSYQFLDAAATNTTMFYRIKQTDKDGRSNYSAVVKITAAGSADILTVSPNPVNVITTITVNKAGSAIIADAAGRVVMELKLSAGANKINLQNLGKGMYILQTMSGESCKLIKQ